MKKATAILTTTLVLMSSVIFAQSELKQYRAGHSFDISLPEYMSRTLGLNTVSAIEYKSVVKDVYGFVIFDTKADLALVDMKYSSINEFYDGFIKDFLKEEENRIVSKPQSQKRGEINFVEADVTYFDKDAEAEIYYLVGIVETKTSFYKVLSWGLAENKDTFKADFQKILYSLKD